MTENDPNAAPQKPTRLGAALRSAFHRAKCTTVACREALLNRKEKFWKSGAVWSVVLCCVAVGAAIIAIVWFTGEGGVGRTWLISNRGSQEPTPAPVETAAAAEPAADTAHRRGIDGLPLAADATEPARYAAVMIDNHVDARPQSGIDAASIVYEAPAEGGINRFMAIFPEDGSVVPKIGPVRSARAYFLDWASEYDALYAHVGGSPEALDLLKSFGMRNLDQFYNGPTFWRDNNREAPHNVYTTLEKLTAADQAHFDARPDVTITPRLFKDDVAPEDRPDSQEVAIDYGDRSMDVTWTYDPKTDDYGRSQGGRVTKTAEGKPVRAKNIVVQYAKISVYDSYGRKRIVTVGDGDALIVLDGLAFTGSWHKNDRTSATTFEDASGNEIRFNAGQTWIQVVPIGTQVTH